MIREATLEDLLELIDMARDMHRTTEFSIFNLHDDKLENYLRSLLQKAFVVISPGRGFFAGEIGPLWFSEELCAWDRILYVYPQHRGKMLGARFISLFEAWAKDQGARAVIVAVSSGVDVARTGKLFEHRGYRCLGGVYRKECV